MKTLALLTCFLAPTLLHADEPTASEKFKSRDNGFTAVFPMKPKVESRLDFSKIGARRHETAIATITSGARFQVIADDLPNIPNLPFPRILLKGMRDGVVGKDGKVVTEEEITLGEQKIGGLALLIEKDATCQRVRLFLFGDRRYEVSVIGTKEEVTSKEADRFLDSFELVK